MIDVYKRQNTYSLFLTVYFYFSRETFDKVLNTFDNAITLLYSSSLCQEKSYVLSLKELVNKLNNFSLYYVVFTISTGTFSVIIRYIRYKLGFSEDSIPIFQFPFEPKTFPLYDITVIYQLGTGLLCVAIRCVTESLFAVYFIYLNFCYKHIGDIFKGVFSTHEINCNSISRLKQWIQIHQEFQR